MTVSICLLNIFKIYIHILDLLIGIHCSDGINRSGYLVCRYLIDRLHMGSDAALDAFEKARGHIIARGSCVQALHRAVAERRNKE